jgi:hypothetical protein
MQVATDVSNPYEIFSTSGISLGSKSGKKARTVPKVMANGRNLERYALLFIEDISSINTQYTSGFTKTIFTDYELSKHQRNLCFRLLMIVVLIFLQ